jgi:hypothetical protein
MGSAQGVHQSCTPSGVGINAGSATAHSTHAPTIHVIGKACVPQRRRPHPVCPSLTWPRAELGRVFLAPEGRRTLVVPLSSSCAMITPYAPEALPIDPRSPGLVSTLQITVPSGMALSGSTLPTVREAACVRAWEGGRRGDKTRLCE